MLFVIVVDVVLDGAEELLDLALGFAAAMDKLQ